VIGLVKSKDGTVSAKYDYSPYGELITSSTGSYAGQANPFRFSTKYFDDETGFYYFGYRYYNPETGRWLNRDPMEEDGGVNLYVYSQNDPIAYGDWLGLWKIDRSGDPRATAEAELDDNVTRQTPMLLADTVGLEREEYMEWMTIPGKGKIKTLWGEKVLQDLDADTPICPCEKVEVPNTILSYWAGELGGFGKFYVMYQMDVDTFKRRGFYVTQGEGWMAAKLESKLADLSGDSSKSLHGIFFWGHGAKNGVGTDTSHRNDPYYGSLYSEWKANLSYKPAIGILYACETIHAKYLFSSNNSIFWGAPGTLVPLPLHCFFPTVAEKVRPGMQGTK
jgi:RHS repeat-associated protein